MRAEKQPPKAPSKLKSCCLREGCEEIDNYKRLNKIHEGEYGVVYRALELPTNQIFAIKKLKLKDDCFPITSLREISILRSLDHPNIIKISRAQRAS
jgi:cell division cycle 2-like